MELYSLLISCEHAGNTVPPHYDSLFINKQDVLNSHRGWDPGAWPLAEALGNHFGIKAIPFFSTRLLIEPNRSVNHPELLSEFSRDLSQEAKDSLLKEFYIPYRERVQAKIESLKKPVLHVSVHTFTPVFAGQERTVDIGLLFDPSRKNEVQFCETWRHQLTKSFPDWKIEFNEPYKGIDDGFTTFLRTQYSDEQYLGIEMEWNQKWATAHDASSYYSEIKQSLAVCSQALY